MSISNRSEMRDGYLYIETTGETLPDVDSVISYIEECLAIAQRHGYPSAMLDRRQVVQRWGPRPGEDEMMERLGTLLMEHGYVRPGPGVTRDRRAAVLVLEEHVSHLLAAEAEFFSRGVNLRYFGDEAEAVAWLQGGDRVG